MSRLAQTEGLTDVQVEILKAVQDYVDNEILPYATHLEHKDEYPADIVEGLKDLGVFGLMIPEEYGGNMMGWLAAMNIPEEIARATTANFHRLFAKVAA